MARLIGLLRGINVGGRSTVPMAELRQLCEALAWRDVETYIQSGNVVFSAGGSPERLEAQLEEALGKRFGFAPAVMVRTHKAWKACADANPFADASAAEPNRVLVGFSKKPLTRGAAEALQERAKAGERVAEAGGAIWFHYPAGAGTSKLTPALIDRIAGSPVTARNWRTMLKLEEMAA